MHERNAQYCAFPCPPALMFVNMAVSLLDEYSLRGQVTVFLPAIHNRGQKLFPVCLVKVHLQRNCAAIGYRRSSRAPGCKPEARGKSGTPKSAYERSSYSGTRSFSLQTHPHAGVLSPEKNPATSCCWPASLADLPFGLAGCPQARHDGTHF